ncbi:MAG TPA: hypothetical protein PLZ13_00165, partial [Ottowia sp.]|nr:hypothetical protein [Ottowia sp.]
MIQISLSYLQHPPFGLSPSAGSGQACRSLALSVVVSPSVMSDGGAAGRDVRPAAHLLFFASPK